ncbi:MAG TPA: LysO family transporter [Bacteroidales bacterium]|nr:LysO family transporter [Bacteroidales bacterium]
MIIILGLFAAGIFLGLIIRKKRKLVLLSEKLTNWAIYLLLLFLGISVGLNPSIISNLNSIGLSATLLTVFAMTGSILVSYLSFKFYVRYRRKKSLHDQQTGKEAQL